jgi:hypothetical protein
VKLGNSTIETRVMPPETQGTKAMKKKNQVSSSGINFSKRVHIERNRPPKKYKDDVDSENVHNPLC